MSSATSTADREAIVYAYPLYEMRRMRAATSPRRVAAHGEASEGQRWCNVFTHSRSLLAPGRSRVVTPNNDTLYSTAWLHVDDEPLVVEVPDTQGRYYVLGLLDFFTNPFAHLGTRLTGNAARRFVLTPPGWQGELPEALQSAGTRVPCPTPWVWVIGRILVDGEHDLPGAHAVQDGLRLHRLGDWVAGRPPRPRAFDPDCDPSAPVGPAHFAHQVRAALGENPPPASDLPQIAALAALGLDPAGPPPADEALRRLGQALDEALALLRNTETGRQTPQGWTLPPLVEGSFGDDHRARALVALKYIGMLESAEAYYPLAWKDEDGEPLTGRRVYTLHFAPGATPPVDAFWSITLYDARDYMLVANPIDRYAIGDRSAGLAWAADGSLTIHIAHEAPQEPDARANWLPAPAGEFYLCLRAYIPRPALLEDRWRPPALRVTGRPAGTADAPGPESRA